MLIACLQYLHYAAWFVEHNNQEFMNHDVDLGDALNFVVKRIEGQATRSGKPLTEEEGFLLNNLPTAPIFPLTASTSPEFPPLPVPRDLAYEQIDCLSKRGTAA